METLVKLLWLWGIGDSLWLALNPTAWARFWGSWIGRIERSPALSSSMAAAQLGLCLYLLRRSFRSER